MVKLYALVLATGLVGATALWGGSAAASAHAAPPTRVYVVQAVADQQWTLSVDDEQVADGAAGKEIIGPLDLAPGDHSVSATDAAGTTVQANVVVDEGDSLDVVLHRPVDPTADPLFTTFSNNVSAVDADTGRLTIAHTAVAPPADIRVEGDVLLADVASAEQISTTVPGGTYSVDIVPTATDGPPVMGPVDLRVKPGRLTRVFAIGVAADRTMDAVVQVLPLPTDNEPTPSDVPAGSGGQGAGLFADRRDPAAPGALVAALLGGAGAVLLALRVRSRRRTG